MSDRMSVSEAQAYLAAYSTGDSVDMWKVRAARTVVAQAEQIDRIRRAVTDPGRHPDYHRHQLERLRTEWPTLYHAIMDLTADPGNAKNAPHRHP